MKKRVNTFILAVLAGLSIALGGAAYLAIENPVAGAATFTLGIFVVMTHGLNLFTGKVAYVFERDRSYALDIPIIWLGNLVGTAGTALLLRSTRLISLAERAAAVSAGKIGDSLWSVFVLAIFCNICIYIAVDGYNNNPHEVGKYLALVFGIVGFIVCGYEHCVANMFYFTLGGAWSGQAVISLLVITAGNCVGGWLFPLLKALIKNLAKQ